MAKYTTITELAEAFKSGELDDSYYISIDKGGNSLRLCKLGTEETEEADYEACQQLFKRPYGCPLEELFALAGIKSEYC